MLLARVQPLESLVLVQGDDDSGCSETGFLQQDVPRIFPERQDLSPTSNLEICSTANMSPSYPLYTTPILSHEK